MNDYPPTLAGNTLLILAILTGAGAGITVALWLTRHWTTEIHEHDIHNPVGKWGG